MNMNQYYSGAPNGNTSGGLFPDPVNFGLARSWVEADDSLDLVELEVLAALPNESQRMLDAKVNEDFYNLRNMWYIEKREAETDYDFEYRPKRYSKITRRVIEVLTAHLYNPGPARRLEGSSAGETMLQNIYDSNHINIVMKEADKLAILNDVSAIQISATGDSAAPVRLHVWGGEEYAVWTRMDDPADPWCVCTISMFNMRRRYQVWTKNEIRTYYTKPLQDGQTAGGTAPSLSNSESGANPYGELPFVFVRNTPSTRDFWGGGIGTALRETNHDVDRELSHLAQIIQRNCTPVGLLINVSEQFRLTTRPGAFQHLLPRNSKDNSLGPPDAKYLQSEMHIAEVWHDIESYVNQTLQELGVPLSAVRMDQQSAMSGIAIVAEQLPLLTRAKDRQTLFSMYEKQLAKKILKISGNYYNRPDLQKAANLVDSSFEILWPDPAVPLPTPERDQSDQSEIAMGIASRVQIVMRRRGLTREQAKAQLEQVAEDISWEKRLFDDPPIDDQEDSEVDPIDDDDDVNDPRDMNI